MEENINWLQIFGDFFPKLYGELGTYISYNNVGRYIEKMHNFLLMFDGPSGLYLCDGYWLEKKNNNRVALNKENVGTKNSPKLISVPACLFGA